MDLLSFNNSLLSFPPLEPLCTIESTTRRSEFSTNKFSGQNSLPIRSLPARSTKHSLETYFKKEELQSGRTNKKNAPAYSPDTVEQALSVRLHDFLNSARSS